MKYLSEFKQNQKSDYKLFKEKLPLWQENYMAKVCEKIQKLTINDEKSAADKFWAIEKTFFKEKKNPGVLMEIPSISNLLYAILDLLNHKVIKMEDLVDFSEEFKEKVEKIQNL